MNPDFWRGRRVFVTGHTGFKGAWLSLWLQKVGAQVTGFALPQATTPGLFEAADVAAAMNSTTGDLRDFSALDAALGESGASVVLHLAAQATVTEGYRDPQGTFATNLTGTLNLLEAIRRCKGIEAAVIVTSDKCYAPSPDGQAHSENATLGGPDPYAASKACAEIATACWRESYFAAEGAPRIATARAGNVIGGGDWSANRLVPDAARAFSSGQPLRLRMPTAVRPWQHVLDALAGYLLLAELAAGEGGKRYAGGWNFGPADANHLTVGEIARRCAELWGDGVSVEFASGNFQHETGCLRLNAARAHAELGWRQRWNADDALRRSIAWYRAWYAGPPDAKTVRCMTLAQIDEYCSPP